MTAVATPPVQRPRRSHPTSETQVWADFGDDVFALLDALGDDLRNLRVRDVALTLANEAPEVLQVALGRAVDAWLTS